MNNNFTDSLKMNSKQKQCFDFGFVNLDLEDVILLLNISEEEYAEQYKYYYDIGNSFCKFETLRKILDKSSNSLDSLKDYGQYRKIKNTDNLTITSSTSTSTPMNTADLIKQLKGQQWTKQQK